MVSEADLVLSDVLRREKCQASLLPEQIKKVAAFTSSSLEVATVLGGFHFHRQARSGEGALAGSAAGSAAGAVGAAAAGEVSSNSRRRMKNARI